jgi:ABC-2 type transport system permease protein
MLEMVYWPFLNVIVWGFLTNFLVTNSSVVAKATGILLGAVLLWDVLFRGQLGVSVSFLEEMWSRNFANLFVSPLHPGEYLGAILIMSFLRILICVIPASLLAIPFFGYNIYTLGLPLVFFVVNLMMMGWWLGLFICGLLLRVGMGAESMAWAVIFLLSPLAGIYYPIATLPVWLQPVAWMLPTSYVFEGMRAIMLQNVVHWEWVAQAFAMNIAYLCLGISFFLYMFHLARRDGRITSTGEY